MKKYSLATYILSVEPNDVSIKNTFGTLAIGGQGSYMDSVRVRTNNNMWDTTPYATGAWVHNKNLSRVGTLEVALNQLSDEVAKFITMCETYYTGDYDGFTLTISRNDGVKVCTCVDCYIAKIPDQEFTAQAANQTWTFTCGQITFN